MIGWNQVPTLNLYSIIVYIATTLSAQLKAERKSTSYSPTCRRPSTECHTPSYYANYGYTAFALPCFAGPKLNSGTELSLSKLVTLAPGRSQRARAFLRAVTSDHCFSCSSSTTSAHRFTRPSAIYYTQTTSKSSLALMIYSLLPIFKEQ